MPLPCHANEQSTSGIGALVVGDRWFKDLLLAIVIRLCSCSEVDALFSILTPQDRRWIVHRPSGVATLCFIVLI